MTPEFKKTKKRFAEEMESVDEVVHALMKGHSLIEEMLTRIIEQHLFNPEYLSGASLRFCQENPRSRSLCLRKDNLGEWTLIHTSAGFLTLFASDARRFRQMIHAQGQALNPDLSELRLWESP